MVNKKKSPQSVSEIFTKHDFVARFSENNRYVNEEFQDFGLRLAMKLNDKIHKALYIKLAKEVPRGYLEAAASFADDYPGANSKGKIFMWKLKEVCKAHNFELTLSKRKKRDKTKPLQTSQIKLL